MDLNLLLRARGGIFTVSLLKNFIIVPQKLTNLHAKRKCSSNIKQERLSEFIKNAFNDTYGIKKGFLLKLFLEELSRP